MKRGKLSFNKPENTFVAIAILFGILFLLITPPFQAPDEYNHFYRTFQISEGKIVAERQQGHIGGLLPRSLVTTAERVSKDLKFHPENKQKPEDIFALLDLPLVSNDRVFVGFPNTAVYTPIPYLPQVVGVGVGRIIGFSPIILTYFGRIFNLLFWVLLEYLAIKITPILKWTFFLLALTPMSLFQAASLSADGVTNSVAALVLAVFLYYALEQSKITIKTRDVFIIILLSIFLILSKQAYLPLLLLFLLIPTKKIGGNKNRCLIFALILLISLSALLVWSLLTKETYTPFPFLPNVSPDKQLLFIFDNPFRFFVIWLNTIKYNGIHYINQFIGLLGWLDTQLPKLHIVSYAIVLVVVSLASGNQNNKISYKQKIIIFMTLVVNTIIVSFILYLTWTPVGGNLIEGIQGRYFIPIAPLLFLLLYNQKTYFDISRFAVFIACYSVFSATVTATVLLHRYYL